MFGASAVRKKREREKREKLARLGGEATIFPYIKPFGPRFDREELPYFKYRRALSSAASEDGSKSTSVADAGVCISMGTFICERTGPAREQKYGHLNAPATTAAKSFPNSGRFKGYSGLF